VVASFIDRVGAAVPVFDAHDAFVEYAGPLPTGNEPGCSSILAYPEHLYSFLQPYLTDAAFYSMASTSKLAFQTRLGACGF
jgi:hypothetical protein